MNCSTTKTQFSGAENYATPTNSTGKKAMSFPVFALLLICSLSSVGCIGLTGAPKVASSQQTTPGAATISVAPASIRFGSVPVGTTSSQSVTISNGGGSSLTVTQASATAAGITITGASFPMVVEAGKQSTFDVVFTPKTPGALSGNVSIMSDLSSAPSMVSVTGTGMAASAILTTSSSSLNFGSVAAGKSSVLGVTLTNSGNSDVTVSKVTVSGTDYLSSGVSAGLTLAPGQSATLDATFAPSAAGNYPGSVTVVSTATNSPANISLSGSGTLAQTQQTTHSVSLTWSPSTSAVAGYNVYRSEVSGGPYSALDSSIVAVDSYTDTNVQSGSTYFYVVKAVTAAGVESADSSQASVSIP